MGEVTGVAINGVSTPTTTVSYTSGNVRVPMSLAQGRRAADGTNPIRVTRLGLYCAGQGASRTMHYYLNSNDSGAFSVPAASRSVYHEHAISFNVHDGGTATLEIAGSGSFYFGHAHKSGYTVVGSYGSWTNESLAGKYNYVQVPSAPGRPILTQDHGDVTSRFHWSGDDGGSPRTGYVLQYATNSSFSGGHVIASNGTNVLSLTAGVQYWFRAAVRNAVSDRWGTYGTYSAVATITVGTDAPRIKIAGTWTDLDWKIKDNNGVWQDLTMQIKVGGVMKSLK